MARNRGAERRTRGTRWSKSAASCRVTGQDRTQHHVTSGALVGQPDEVERARRVDDLAGPNAESMPPTKHAAKGGEISGKAREGVDPSRRLAPQASLEEWRARFGAWLARMIHERFL